MASLHLYDNPVELHERQVQRPSQELAIKVYAGLLGAAEVTQIGGIEERGAFGRVVRDLEA